MKWDIVWKNKIWRSESGYVIARYWDLIGVDGASYFMCFKNDDDHHSGINFCTKDTLREAKAMCAQSKQTDFNCLSKDAQETAIGMIEFCIENRFCMGMHEGETVEGIEDGFLTELRNFIE